MEASVIATVFATALVVPYIVAGLVGVKSLIVDGPAFERKSSRFDLRIDMGDHVRLIQSKPAPIVWEEPEAYFPIQNEIREYIAPHTFVVSHI